MRQLVSMTRHIWGQGGIQFWTQWPHLPMFQWFSGLYIAGKAFFPQKFPPPPPPPTVPRWHVDSHVHARKKEPLHWDIGCEQGRRRRAGNEIYILISRAVVVCSPARSLSPFWITAASGGVLQMTSANTWAPLTTITLLISAVQGCTKWCTKYS